MKSLNPLKLISVTYNLISNLLIEVVFLFCLFLRWLQKSIQFTMYRTAVLRVCLVKSRRAVLGCQGPRTLWHAWTLRNCMSLWKIFLGFLVETFPSRRKTVQCHGVLLECSWMSESAMGLCSEFTRSNCRTVKTENDNYTRAFRLNVFWEFV